MATVDKPTPTLKMKPQEEFVQGLNGSSKEDVMSFLTQVPLLVFITLFIKLCILAKLDFGSLRRKYSDKGLGKVLTFLLEFITIVVPLVFIFTVLSESMLFIFLLAVFLIGLIITQSATVVNDMVNYWKIPHFKGALFTDDTLLGIGPRPFITYFRALTFLVTSLSIMAVDFHVYPRRFAKTETYGVSLMDIGVGLFVFSNAIVLSNRKLQLKKLKHTLLESSIFIILGILRYVCIERLDYQKHITEYGEHWNFFITLGMVKVLSHIIIKVAKGHSFLCGLFFLALHQYFLTHSWESYVLNNVERNTLLSANREGIVSLGGYLSLYLLVVGHTSLIDFDRPINLKKKIKLLILLAFYNAVLFALSYYFDTINLQVSRRLANLPYTLWIIAVGLTLLSITLLMEIMSVIFLPLSLRYNKELYSLITPVVLESINFNGLVFFLVSNLLTGLVNLTFDVFNMETNSSIAILLGYMFFNCSIVFLMYLYNIRLKIA